MRSYSDEESVAATGASATAATSGDAAAGGVAGDVAGDVAGGVAGGVVGGLSVDVERVLAGVEGLLDEVGVLVDAGLGRGPGEVGVLLRLMMVSRRVEALTAAVGAQVDAGGEWAQRGHRSLRAWLVACSNTSVGWAARVCGQGRAERVCPLLVAAWRAGVVQWEHVRVVVDAHRRFPRVRVALQDAEADIVAAARVVDPDTLSGELFGLLHALDPEAVDEVMAARRRGEVGLHVSTVLDGFVRVDGLLPPEVGQCLLSVLAAARDTLRRGTHEDSSGREDADRDSTDRDSTDSDNPDRDSSGREDADRDSSGRDNPGRDSSGREDSSGVPEGPVDGRVPVSVRNVEALQFVLGIAASVSGPGGVASLHGSRPVLHVQVGTQALVEGTVPGWIEGVAGGRVTPVTASAAQRLACDSVRRVVVLDERGTVDAISALRRVVPQVMRRIVRLRDDGTCRFPGCRSIIHEVHHLVHWAHGGVTTSDNLAGLCWHHHRLVHEGGWSVSGDANGLIMFTSRHGHRYPSRPPQRAPRLSPPATTRTTHTTQRC